mmetsp:Transcript_15479/g.41565  ORF Transcript_15479/g.41565 Transcript_15479/m.41565 type:complete len:332 (-) Transcript_15479:184-1179(-)|eukprot:CAMPEP_0185829856 /NCGR_PEP_ID=MMETSP1353-20130828/486_1 /TAXON_ID=1077150 /ORGANISM="Erythrolobus australicus, Strain CCMP3124" /LENGTH=331 /DNA_ID=CAMNT_0028527687 /DNA_START=45 /DNA_END=1040 /DNA_ORIENTATION=-
MASEVLHMEREAFGKAARVAPNLWVYATMHRLGQLKQMPTLNNRAFFSVVTEKATGQRALVAIGTPDPAERYQSAVREIEQETGLKLRHVIAQCGIHNLFLLRYIEIFGESLHVYVPPARVEHQATLKMAVANHPRQVHVLDNEADPLHFLHSDFDSVLVGGLGVHADTPAPENPGQNSLWFFLATMPTLMNTKATPYDQIVVFHKPTRLAIGSDLIMFYFPPGAQVPPLLKLFGCGQDVFKFAADNISCRDRAKLVTAWNKVLTWPVAIYCGYHEAPGVVVSGERFLKLIREDKSGLGLSEPQTKTLSYALATAVLVVGALLAALFISKN